MKTLKNLCGALIGALAMVVAQPAMALTTVHTSQTIVGSAACNATNSLIGSASTVIIFNSGSNVQAGDTVTIGFNVKGTGNFVGYAVYTFVTNTFTNIPVYGVAVGTNFAQSSTNLLQAIQGLNTGNGTNYGTNTPANILVTVAQTTSNTLTLTASSLYPATKGNDIGVSFFDPDNDLQTLFNTRGLYGGYDNVFGPFNAGLSGLGISITEIGTNSASVSNLLVSFGIAAVKTNLYNVTTNLLNPLLYYPITCGGTTNVSWFTNVAQSTIGASQYVGIEQVGNNDKTNNIQYSITFSWMEDNGK